ncbi:hypothetical protein KAH43_07265, partial [Candidatus Bipolaricaulota bacterium]|nr:hypothetical protein [Candidatus Bipolaricaulota bacterium]
LVLAFGWGKCSSQLLYRGMVMNVALPDRDFHVALAAAPVRLLYSLEDLFKLESIDAFKETLYQQYQSPYSARLATATFEGVAEFRSMVSAIGDESAEYDVADLQAASLVQHLINCGGGLEAFRDIWGPGTTTALISRLACGPLAELFDEWLAVIQSTDPSSSEYEYYRARFLFEAGEIESAAQITEPWIANDLSILERALAVQTQLAVGNFEIAAQFAGATEGVASEVLQDWVSTYDGWEQVSEGRFTIFGNGSRAALEERLYQTRLAYQRATDALGFSESQLPEHITVFYYDSEEASERGTTIIPAVDIHQTIWHVSSQDNLIEEFVMTLPSFVTKKTTVSNILRRGLSAVVTIDRSELVSQGCELLRLGEWTPFWRVGFGGLPDQLFEVQTGLMILYIVETYGMGVIPDLWVATARIGGGVSLDTAIHNVLGISRTDIEQEVLDSVLICE